MGHSHRWPGSGAASKTALALHQQDFKTSDKLQLQQTQPLPAETSRCGQGHRRSWAHFRAQVLPAHVNEVRPTFRNYAHILLLTRHSPEQIRALRSEADSVDPVDSPELGPPPMSHLIEDEPVKIDSPRAPPPKQSSPSPKGIVEPPMALHSRNAESDYQQSPSPQKKRDAFSRRNESRPNLQSSGPDTQDEPSPSPLKKRDVLSYPAKDKPQQRGPKPKESQIQTPSASQAPAATPTKAGIKRKFTPGDEASNTKPMAKATSENQPPRPMTGGKSLKELSNMRKEERPGSQPHRKPLSAKSTNDDIVSPKKKPRQLATDEVIAAKSNLKKCKATQDQAKTKAKTSAPVRVDVAPEPEPAPVVATVTSDLATPLAEPELLAPNSPVSAPPADAPRGDTPPPADISSKGETSRPSRRSRGVVSYTEPNLRDKMRRPTKDMVDAVAGSRCSSHFELIGHDSLQSKRDSGSGMSSEPPASPLAGKGSSSEELPHSVAADRRHRPSAVVDAERYKDESPESIPTSDADLYEITTSSPPAEKQGKRRSTNRQGKSSRRFSTALDGGDDDDVFIPSERASSRRRSMMV